MYNAGKDILQAFLAGHEEGRASKALKLKNEQETADREARAAEHDKTLQQADKQFSVTSALAKATHDANIQKMRMDIADRLSSGKPAGVPVSKSPNSTPQQDMESLNSQTFSHNDPLTMQRIMGMVPGAQGPSMTNTADYGGEIGAVPFQDPLSHAADQADITRTLMQPKLEGEERLLGIKNQQAEMLAQMKLDQQMQIETAKFKERQNTNAERFKQQQSLVRLRASLRPAKSGSDKYLSPDDAIKLNVPYGTTQGEAARMNIQPEKPRTAAEQARLDGFIALRKELSDLRELGDNINWSENYSVGGKLIGKATTKFGMGTKDQKDFRTMIGKMNAEQIHQSYGSVFSRNEQGLASTWLPSLSMDGSSAKSMLENGEQYATTQINQLLAPSATTRRGTGAAPAPEKGVVRKRIKDPDNPGKMIDVVSRDGGIRFTEE